MFYVTAKDDVGCLGEKSLGHVRRVRGFSPHIFLRGMRLFPDEPGESSGARQCTW